ncbi:MAG TPA: hypothetical protein VMT95_01445 [Candidatus Binatia bacterium]|nr:hypothetical protein [Candidatus Binatia bacterium]
MTDEGRDLLRNLRVVAGAFVLPILAIVAIGFFSVDSRVQAVVWAAALGVMAAACALNAWRCGRLHCYFTAPFLFVMAAAALLLGFGPLGRIYAAWNVLGLVVIVGAVVLTWLPERIFGRYRRRAGSG